MNRRVYKYRLVIDGRVHMINPDVWVVGQLSVGLDPQGELCMWILVNTGLVGLDQPPIYYLAVGTGMPDPIPETFEFMGTVRKGVLMLHVFTKYKAATT